VKPEPFRREDIAAFLALAATEGWVVEGWELEFLLAVFPQGCLVVRGAAGAGIGFVTAVRHSNSGWIGNLIVAQHFRGQGLGAALFRSALQALRSAGVDTVWLTASQDGLPLYQKHGFRRLDSVCRWVGAGQQRHASHEQMPAAEVPGEAVYRLDGLGWGDQRRRLLAAVSERGRLLEGASGFMIMQPSGAHQQFGPFAAADQDVAARLLNQGLGSVPLAARIYLDVPASNRTAARLLKRRGFRISGRTELMYAGARPDYHPELIYGLATMGSCG